MRIKRWVIRSAAKAAKFILRHPFSNYHSSDWSEFDHQHICIAARILQQDDFEAVCPMHGKCEIDWDDACDHCSYFKILDFDTGDNGEKKITLT